jgi:hypothetical protein
MSHTIQFLQEARRRGLHIAPRGSNGLWVWPRSLMTNDLAAELRAHKRELITWLKGQHLLKQTLAGEFEGATARQRRTVRAKLAKLHSPLVRRALENLT